MACIIDIKVIPASGRSQWVLDKSGVLKCYLKSAAQKGLANKELIKFIANSLDVPQASIEIIAGQTARKKKVKINENVTYAMVLECIGLQPVDKQQKLF